MVSVKDFTVMKGDMRIKCWFYKPDIEREKYPVVIACHGFSAYHAPLVQSAEVFAKIGVATVLFDFCGGGPLCVSDGDTLQMSIMTEVEDLHAVYNCVKEMDLVDPENIFLMGESQGGAVAAIGAGDLGEGVRGLMLTYPGLMLPDKVRGYFDSREEIPDTRFEFVMTVGRKYYEDIYDLNLYSRAAKYKGPVCIVHGDRDSAVPIRESFKAISMYKNATLTILPGREHGFEGKDKVLCANIYVGFMASIL